MLQAAPRVVGAACVIVLMMGPVVLLSPDRASADEVERDAVKPLLLSREILAHVDERRLPEGPGWVSAHFHLAGKGVRYSQPLSMGKRQLLLNVSGPVMRRSLGLNFEVRF